MINELNLSSILHSLNEAEDITSVAKYLPKESFERFQTELSKAIEMLKKEVKAKVVGRLVTFRGAKGFGQIEQDHQATISDVDLVLYQDKYTLLFKGSEGKSKKQNEYYIDPTAPTYMKISRAPTTDITPQNQPQPQPVVRKIQTPQKPVAKPQAPAPRPAPRAVQQAPFQVAPQPQRRV